MNELIARVEWNENIHVDENRRRVDALFSDYEIIKNDNPNATEADMVFDNYALERFRLNDGLRSAPYILPKYSSGYFLPCVPTRRSVCPPLSGAIVLQKQHLSRIRYTIWLLSRFPVSRWYILLPPVRLRHGRILQSGYISALCGSLYGRVLLPGWWPGFPHR